MDKVELLADYLGCDVDDINELDSVSFETPDGDYYVCDEYEAEDLVYQDIETTIDDMGLSAFTPDFQNWIIDNAVNKNDLFFEELRNDYAQEEVDGMEDEEIVEFCIENGIIEEEEIYDYEIDELRDKCFYDYVEAYPAFDFYIDNFGYDELGQDVTNNTNLLDMDSIVQECIEWDGIAHFLARYDGEEINLGDGYYAFRYN